MQQTFRAASAIITYDMLSTRDEHIKNVLVSSRQGFRTTFYDPKCSIMFHKAGCYVQHVIGYMEKTSPLNQEMIPIVFETLMWFHYVNMVFETMLTQWNHIGVSKAVVESTYILTLSRSVLPGHEFSKQIL